MEGITTLLQAVLMTEEALLSVRNFGETTFAELQSKASEYSGLKLHLRSKD
jgi:DNA-directed RNA polymerase alpha subunit